MRENVETRLGFEVGITEHCNLNCRGCSHFSPSAEPYYMDIAVFERDMSRMAVLLRGKVAWIHIMGGEPLLHPDCPRFLSAARNAFPDARIDLITNGILLERQPESFWMCCHEQSIVLKPTRYPISVDFDQVRSLADKYGVMFRFYNYEDENGEKSLSKYVLDPSGGQDEKWEFSHCSQANKCLTLREGKLYTCPTIPCSRHFSSFFGKELPVTPEDYADIYQVSGEEELLCRMVTAPSFCRFCAHQEDISGMKWGVSQKQMDEWA